MLHISQIAEACKGKWLQEAADTEIRFISTDSRKINDPEHALFAAIKTERRDGHDHIGEAYNKGVRNFLVTSEPVLADFPGASFILVNSTVAALQIIAAAIRNRFEIPVIGITGSNGKTIVKEWLFQLLQQDHNVIRSPKSYNSQIGVPLSVWQMNDEHSLAIFEAGISQPDEMAHLEQVMRPTIGVFTNIGEAHSQGFLNTRQKINEKLQLFRHTDTLVYCRDYHELHECVLLYTHLLQTNLKKELKLFSWSYKHEATLQVKEVTKADGRTQISALYQGRLLQTSIPFTDAASIENAINCWCVLLLLGVEDHTIAARMWELKPIAMRLELRQGENNCSIINDAYNSDITSLQVALDLLDQQKQHKKTIVLSDIQQAGKTDHILYTEVADILGRRKISRFFGIGKGLEQQRHLFEAVPGMECHFFPATEDFVKHMPGFVFEDEAILLKGARSFAFEQISLVLEQKIHQTVMSISLSALRHNLEVFRGRLKAGVRTMAMVKAASYGTGGYEIARTLQESGVDYLTVAYPDEGVALRREGITLPIMVMSPSTISFDRMIIWNLEPELFNLRSLNQFLEIARKLQVTDYPVHIKLDTGMHRLGFSPEEVPALLQALKDRPELKIASIFSHLAASDDASFDDFTTQQADAFVAMSEEIIAAIGYRPLRHLCNTAGIAAYPEYHFDMVRLGLGLYGIDSSNILTTELQQISTLRTTIAQIKQVPAGDTIGYSRKGKAEQDMRIATICIGYADGYPRALNNGKSYVMINNRPAPLIGVIAMDMCMVDITAIDGVQEGDEVIIFGPQLSIRQLAEWAGTISYEIMTGISQRVKRVYVNEAE